jgi:hypothetical protein
MIATISAKILPALGARVRGRVDFAAGLRFRPGQMAQRQARREIGLAVLARLAEDGGSHGAPAAPIGLVDLAQPSLLPGPCPPLLARQLARRDRERFAEGDDAIGARQALGLPWMGENLQICVFILRLFLALQSDGAGSSEAHALNSHLIRGTDRFSVRLRGFPQPRKWGP